MNVYRTPVPMDQPVLMGLENSLVFVLREEMDRFANQVSVFFSFKILEVTINELHSNTKLNIIEVNAHFLLHFDLWCDIWIWM